MFSRQGPPCSRKNIRRFKCHEGRSDEWVARGKTWHSASRGIVEYDATRDGGRDDAIRDVTDESDPAERERVEAVVLANVDGMLVTELVRALGSPVAGSELCGA